MANIIPNVGSQIDRALRAYFIQNSATPQSAPDNGGIFLTLDSGDRTNPLRTIFAHDGQESVKFSGSQEYMVLITDQFDAVIQPGQTNPGFNRVSIDAQVGAMMYLMMQSSDGATLNQTVKNITDAGRALVVLKSAGGLAPTQQDADNDADMADFTCMFVEPAGQKRGHPVNDEHGGIERTFWVESRAFRITAAPSKILGYSNDPTE
jgi:hypothetical protein